MRTSLIAAVSAIGLLGGSALAQTSSPTPPPSAVPSSRAMAPGAPSAAQPAPPRAPAPNPLTMEDTGKIKGSSVYGSDDKKIGAVETVLMKPESKTVDRLVVSAGGILGIGGHDVALPIDEFKWDGNKDAFVINETAAQLKSMPEWKSASAAAAPSSAPLGSVGSSSGAPSSGSSGTSD